MSWLLSALIGVSTAVVGCFAAGLLGAGCVRWYRISSFEGGSGYYMLAFAFFGTLLGLIGGIIGSRFVPTATDMIFLKGVGLTAGGMIGLVAIVGVFCRLAADVAPRIDGKALELAVEIRGGKSFSLPVKADDCTPFAGVQLLQGRRQPTTELDFSEAKRVDGRWVFPITVPLDTSSSRKFFRAYFNKENDGFFSLPLRSHPKRADFEWSGWIDSGWTSGEPEPPGDEKLSLRYRVQVVEPPPPGPTLAQLEAEKAAKEQAAFDALGADAPLTAWLPYTRYGAREDRLAVAVEHMIARPNFIADLGDLMLSSDQETAVDALRVIDHLSVPPAELTPRVTDAGRALIALIRKVNATTPAEDPGYVGAADVSVRFSAWMVAVRALRTKIGADFTPQLAEILELSRVREDSYVMNQDVRRVASYYMHEWAGLAPLAGDPKPR